MKRQMALVLMITLAGCESAEERCNAAKVAAHDAWDAWATRSEEEHARAESMRLACMTNPAEGCLRAVGLVELVAGPSTRVLRRLRDRAAGGALEFRDAVTRFRDDHRITADDPVEQRAFDASAAHWDACHEVNP